ncbi:MAG: EF-hand domain-containing protein [archaeon]|nr:EF-hand domain-containing protein [archaeon]
MSSKPPKIIPGTMLAMMVEKAFKEADTNHNGKIEVDELHAVLVKTAKDLGIEPPTKEQSEAAMKELDYDKNGTLDMNEYSVLVKQFVKKQAQIKD